MSLTTRKFQNDKEKIISMISRKYELIVVTDHELRYISYVICSMILVLDIHNVLDHNIIQWTMDMITRHHGQENFSCILIRDRGHDYK